MRKINPLTLSLAATTRPHLTLRLSKMDSTSFTSFRPPCHHGHRATTYHTTVCHATRLWCHATRLWCLVPHLCIRLHILTVITLARVVTLLPRLDTLCGRAHHQLHYLISGGSQKHFLADRVLFSMTTGFGHWSLQFGVLTSYSSGSPLLSRHPDRQQPFYYPALPAFSPAPRPPPAIQDRRMAACTPVGAPTTNGHSR